LVKESLCWLSAAREIDKKKNVIKRYFIKRSNISIDVYKTGIQPENTVPFNILFWLIQCEILMFIFS